MHEGAHRADRGTRIIKPVFRHRQAVVGIGLLGPQINGALKGLARIRQALLGEQSKAQIDMKLGDHRCTTRQSFEPGDGPVDVPGPKMTQGLREGRFQLLLIGWPSWWLKGWLIGRPLRNPVRCRMGHPSWRIGGWRQRNCNRRRRARSEQRRHARGKRQHAREHEPAAAHVTLHITPLCGVTLST